MFIVEVVSTDAISALHTDAISENDITKAVLLIQISQHIPLAFKSLRVEFAKAMLDIMLKKDHNKLEVNSLLARADLASPALKSVCKLPSDETLWEVSYIMSSELCKTSL